MATEWYYKSDDRVTGPMGSREILILVKKGQIVSETLLCRESTGPWVPAGDLLPAFQQKPSADQPSQVQSEDDRSQVDVDEDNLNEFAKVPLGHGGNKTPGFKANYEAGRIIRRFFTYLFLLVTTTGDDDSPVATRRLKPRVLVAAAITIVALYAWHSFLNHNRYSIVVSGKGITYEVDRRTGKAWMLRGNIKTEVKKPAPPPAKKQKASLPPSDLAKLAAKVRAIGDRVNIDLYNGSDWMVTDVRVRLRVVPSKSTTRGISRLYAGHILYSSISPFTTGSLTINVSDLPAPQTWESWAYDIEEASGYYAPE